MRIGSHTNQFSLETHVPGRHHGNIRPAAPRHSACMAAKTGRAFEANGLEPGEMADINAFVDCGRRAHPGGDCRAAGCRRAERGDTVASLGARRLDYTHQFSTGSPM